MEHGAHGANPGDFFGGFLRVEPHVNSAGVWATGNVFVPVDVQGFGALHMAGCRVEELAGGAHGATCQVVKATSMRGMNLRPLWPQEGDSRVMQLRAAPMFANGP